MALNRQHIAAAPAAEPARISVVVCAYNEERYVKACLHSVLAQSRQPDEVLVVNNASTDGTRRIAERIEGVEVIDEWRRGLVRAREAGRRHTTGDLLVYLDADSRLPLGWLEMVERAFRRRPGLVGLSGAFRFYDWDSWGRFLVWLYDSTVAPLTHGLVHHVLGIGAVFYGGAFCVRRQALDAIGGFDTTIEFHGEDTNLGRRLTAVGTVKLTSRRPVFTSARRYRACGKRAVFRLYIRNFCSELLRHRPRDTQHVDVRVSVPGPR
jgi:glycosyltransferase involved in cell wall biosynthesis